MTAWRATALGVLVCLACLAPPADAARRSRGTGGKQRAVASPDGARLALVDRQGRVTVDGVRVRCGDGRAVGQPTWRADGRALAFLVRAGLNTQLVVLPNLDPQHPLVWRLPSTAASMRHLSWIGARQVGVGDKELVPRLAVSWSTPVASLNLW